MSHCFWEGKWVRDEREISSEGAEDCLGLGLHSRARDPMAPSSSPLPSHGHCSAPSSLRDPGYFLTPPTRPPSPLKP